MSKKTKEAILQNADIKTQIHQPTKPKLNAIPPKPGKFNLNYLAIALMIAAAGTLLYKLIDKYTAWGNTPVLIKREIDEAEKNSIYKKYDDAEKQYQDIIDRWGKNDKYKDYTKQTELNLARAYKDSENFNAAISLYRRLADENKANKDMYAWLMLELGDCMNKILDTAGAIQTYGTILNEFSDTDWAAEAMFGIAEANENRKNYSEALRFYRMIIDKYKKGFLSAEAMTAIGGLYEQQGKLKAAYDVYDKVVKDYPDIVTDMAKSRLESLKPKMKDHE